MSRASKPADTSGGSSSNPLRADAGELRKWIRVSVSNVRARLTWKHDGIEVALHAELVDISGGGAAIVTLGSPPGDRSLWLYLDDASVAAEPIKAHVLETRLLETGKTFVRLKFDSASALEGAVFAREERRSWRRFPVRERDALLDWQEDVETHSVAVELLNIGGGGCGAIRCGTAWPPASLVQSEGGKWRIESHSS